MQRSVWVRHFEMCHIKVKKKKGERKRGIELLNVSSADASSLLLLCMYAPECVFVRVCVHQLTPNVFNK